MNAYYFYGYSSDGVASRPPGLSNEVFRGKGSDAQWGMEMEVEVRATDHPDLHSPSTATKPLYISFKVSGERRGDM